MALPVNIEKLIHGGTVEWERIEFKAGWNPESIIHTMCAFANDLHNWGGGYIVIGIEEKDGKPELPPTGLSQDSLDSLQKKIIELGFQIQPYYHPIIQPYVLKDRHILVLWCPAGDSRMYTAPTTLGAKAQRQPYMRIGCETIVAKGENLRRLMELTARIPFDDRINNQATIDAFDLALIQAFLQEVKSDLYAESIRMPLSDLAKAMYIAKGPDEDLHPVNVGLLFFSQKPERFFPRSWIELVWHKDGSGQRFEEHYFKGPLHRQLRDAISFIRTNIIAEKVIKQSDRIEATRFYNFPLAAVEESLSNAVYHKSYERQSPIEIQVWQDKIEILSFPGPIPPVNKKVLETERRIVTREYRNRRIGDFLKELELTEGRGTGFPAIYDALKSNGSPAPIFKTDDECSYFLTVIEVHPLIDKTYPQSTENKHKPFVFNSLEDIIRFANQTSDQVSDQVSDQENVQKAIKQSANNQDNDIANEATNQVDEASNQVSNQVNNQTNDITGPKKSFQINDIQHINKTINQTIYQVDKANDQVSDQVNDHVSDQVRQILNYEVTPFAENILNFVEITERSRKIILANCGLGNHTDNKKRHIDPLFKLGWITFTIPDNPKDRNQKYKITKSGERVLWLLGGKKD